MSVRGELAKVSDDWKPKADRRRANIVTQAVSRDFHSADSMKPRPQRKPAFMNPRSRFG